MAASRSLAAPVALRRRRFRPWLRAVVVSHAPGLRGIPSRGQRSSARATASCAHSSARSQSPVTPIKVATMRPHSRRKTVATASSTSLRPARVASPQLIRTWPPDAWRPRQWLSSRSSHPIRSEPENVLLVSANGPSDTKCLVVAHPHHRRRGGGAQPAAELAHPSIVHLLDPVTGLRHHCVIDILESNCRFRFDSTRSSADTASHTLPRYWWFSLRCHAPQQEMTSAAPNWPLR